MRRRLLLLWTPLVLGLVLVLPAATVASSGFSFTIVQDKCINTNVASLKVTFTAAGTTHADRLNVYSWVDERVNHHWKETVEYATHKHAWAIDGQSHSFTIFHARAEVAGRKLRISTEARWYHNDGNQIWTLLHRVIVIGVIC